MTKEYLAQNTRTRCIYANEKNCRIFAPNFWGQGWCNSEVVHRKERWEVESGEDSPRVLAIILFFYKLQVYIIMYACTLLYILALEEYDSPITEPKSVVLPITP